MTTVNIFETASRQKLRFQSTKGALTVEQMWDLPLTSANGVSLDGIGQGIQRELRDLSTDSLVDNTPSTLKTGLNLALDVVKRIIEVKQTENAAKVQARANAAERARLMEALEAKQGEKLATMDVEDIEARLAQLSA